MYSKISPVKDCSGRVLWQLFCDYKPRMIPTATTFVTSKRGLEASLVMHHENIACRKPNILIKYDASMCFEVHCIHTTPWSGQRLRHGYKNSVTQYLFGTTGAPGTIHLS